MKPNEAGSAAHQRQDPSFRQFGDNLTASVSDIIRRKIAESRGDTRLTVSNRTETFLRRLIPTLIVALLVLVAATRFVSLADRASNIEYSAKLQLATLSHLIATRLESRPGVDFALEAPSLVDTYLAASVPDELMAPGLSIYLIDQNGKVVSHLPGALGLQGVFATRLLGIKAATLGAAPEEISLDGVQPVLALQKPIGDVESPLGTLIIARSTDAVFAEWNRMVRINLILFLAMSFVIFVVLYAYFAQDARRRAAERLYSETNTRFDTALARGHCGMWDWDLARGRVIWSRSMFEMLGINSGESIVSFGELKRLLHADDGDMLALADSIFRSDSKQIDHRFRMMHASGSWVWVRLRAELVKHRSGHPHLIGIAVDISEQEALKQQNRNADIRLRDAIENISEAFVLWDAGKRLVLCNTKYQQLYALPNTAVESGTSYEDIQRLSRKPRVRTPMTPDVRQDLDTQVFEAQIEDGRWLQINEKRTRDGGFVSIGTDITQIKRNEEKLVDSERRHMATIADLRNTKQELERQAQKLVEFADTLKEEKSRANAANDAKSHFLANISHELRTPLNAIIGFSDIMRSQMFGELGSDKYEEYATDIHNSGNFLLGVINDVLDMSKIEAGRMQLSPEMVDVDVLMEETLRIVHVQAESSKITVDKNVPSGLEVNADRRAVKQIMLNLLSNAVKFTPEGGHIAVIAKKLKSSIVIVVRDDGRGISKESLKRLGQPFEQVQDQFTKDHKGSGLGLAIARSLAGLHGGTLKIRSEVGQGTMVAVRLPLTCVEQPCLGDPVDG